MAGTQAIDRAAQLLVRVVESARPLAVGELADGSQLPKSTTSRLLSALERQGLLQRDGDRGPVRPGPVLLRFAQTTQPDVTLIDLADEHLDALAAESGETINLAVPTPLGVDQLSLGLTALAAPVFGGGDQPVAALSISGPTIRLTRSRIEQLAPALVHHALALSRKLGHQDDKRGAA